MRKNDGTYHAIIEKIAKVRRSKQIVVNVEQRSKRAKGRKKVKVVEGGQHLHPSSADR